VRRPLLLVALAVVAAGAAVIAIGQPQTVDVPPSTRAPAHATADVAPAEPVADEAAGADDPAVDEAPSPEALAHEAAAKARRESRQQPDARKAASFASAWNGIQYRLSSRKEPAAEQISSKIEPLVRAFRDAYQHADQADLPGLLARSDALKAELEASGLVDGTLRAQVDRLGRLAEAGAPSPTTSPSEPEDEPPTPE
jgi:hypothetical protein